MQRPTSITVCGLLNFGFGLLSLLMVLLTTYMVKVSTGPNPIVQTFSESAAYQTWVKISVPLQIFAGVLALSAGIGLLLEREWGRLLSVVYAIFSLLAGVASLVFTYFIMVEPMLNRARSSHDPLATGAAIGGAFGGLIGGLLGLVYPVVLLILMTRPRVVAAFLPPLQPPTLPPVE